MTLIQKVSTEDQAIEREAIQHHTHGVTTGRWWFKDGIRFLQQWTGDSHGHHRSWHLWFFVLIGWGCKTALQASSKTCKKNILSLINICWILICNIIIHYKIIHNFYINPKSMIRTNNLWYLRIIVSNIAMDLGSLNLR